MAVVFLQSLSQGNYSPPPLLACNPPNVGNNRAVCGNLITAFELSHGLWSGIASETVHINTLGNNRNPILTDPSQFLEGPLRTGREHYHMICTPQSCQFDKTGHRLQGVIQ